MPQFINLTSLEKNELLLRTSSKLNISPILLEKDFWVSWLLNKIFQQEFSKDITFKGGTSLSKCYGYISRFSEDIDLTINRRIFMSDIDDNELSKKGLEKLIDKNDKLASNYVLDSFKPLLENVIVKDLGVEGWQIIPDEVEPKNIRFYYPSILKTMDNPYIKKSVLLELGVRGDIDPFEIRTVKSYVEESFSDILDFETVSIRTLSPVRTFWEKITLIHAENNRPAEKALGDRLSRHYYDIHQLLKNGIADSALKDLSLLYDVIDHKNKYFRSGWTKYEEAIPGSLCITPHVTLREKLDSDYRQMEQMIFGSIPAFSDVLESIRMFENQLNAKSTG